MLCKSNNTYLSVKGILSQLKYTLKRFCIDLLHFQAVFPPLENKSFIQFFKVIPCVAFLSKNVNGCAPFPSLAEPCGFVLICVCVDHDREPQPVYIFLSNCVERPVALQVAIRHPHLLPFKADLELQADGMVFLVDGDNVVQCH